MGNQQTSGEYERRAPGACTCVHGFTNAGKSAFYGLSVAGEEDERRKMEEGGKGKVDDAQPAGRERVETRRG